MTFDEALLTLGIAAPYDEAVARHAYLRLIKTHSPERDPSGFQRVRAAYELLRSTSDLFVKQTPSIIEQGPVESAAVSITLPREQTEVEPAWSQRALALAQRGAAATAVDAALKGLAEEAPDASSPFHHFALTDLGLSLLAQGELAEAKRFMAGYAATEALLPPRDPLAFELLRELSAVSDELPTDLTRALAESFRAAQPERVDATLTAWARRHPLRARALRARLERDAPTLLRFYASSLAAWSVPKLRANGWVLFIAVQALLSAARFCKSSVDEGEDASYWNQMLHIASHQSDGHVVIHSCAPSSHPLCTTLEELARAPNCTGRISLANKLMHYSEDASLAARLTREDADVIGQLRSQTYEQCGGAP